MPVTAFDDSVQTYVHVKDVAEAIVRALEKENNLGKKYLIGKEALPYREYNWLISELSGVPLPKMRLPGSLVMAQAMLLTGLADLTKKPPLWQMSADAIRTARENLWFDGSKAEKELGIVYTPIRVAIEDEIAADRA